MSRTNRVPVGYLELLGIKNAGLTLPQSADFMQPSMEMADFYGSILWGSELASAANAAAPNPATITVPGGEIWFLQSAALTSTFDSASAAQWATRILIAPIGASAQGTVVAAKQQFLNLALNAGSIPYSYELAWQPPRPWILRPGSTIIGNVLELDAGNVANVLQAMFYRVPF